MTRCHGRSLRWLVPGLVVLLSGAVVATPPSQPSDAELVEQLRCGPGTGKYPVSASGKAFGTVELCRRNAADQLGRRGSEEGLRAILASGDPQLINEYAAGLEWSTPFFTNAERARTLQVLLARPDLSRSAYGGLAAALTRASVPGLEANLVAALPSLPHDAKRALVLAFAERRNAAVVPYLLEMLRQAERQGDWAACKAMAAIGTAEAVAETVRCVAPIARSSSGSIPTVLQALGKSGGVPLAIARLKAALPDPMPPEILAAYVAMIAARQEPAGVPDLLEFLRRDVPRPPTMQLTPLDALARFDDPKVWEQARREVEKLYTAGQLPKPRYDYAVHLLDGQLANPERVREQGRLARGGQALEEERRALRGRAEAIAQLRTSDPTRYLNESERYLGDLRALSDRYAEFPTSRGLRGDINREAMELATFARFRLRQPRRAIALLETIGRGDQEDEADWLALDIGDVYEFDLANPKGAIEAYTKGLTRLRNTPRAHKYEEEVMRTWWARALEEEINHLRTGGHFHGTLSEAEADGFLMLTMFSGLMGPLIADAADSPALMGLWQSERDMRPDPAAIAQELGKLPPSHVVLQATLPFLSFLPDEKSVRAYLARNDPSGFWTANIASLVGRAERQTHAGQPEGSRPPLALGMLPGLVRKSGDPEPPLVVVARQLAKQYGVAPREPDPRKSSPEATWALFLASLRSGDAKTAVGCFSGQRRAQVEPWLKALSAEELTKIADSHQGFQVSSKYDEYVEAAIGRRTARGNLVGLATFMNAEGEWLIIEGP